jgi:tellurite resistance protein
MWPKRVTVELSFRWRRDRASGTVHFGMSETKRAEIGLCLLLAAADGDVSEREIAALSSRLGSLLGEDYPALAAGILADGEIGRMAELGPERYVEGLAARIPESRRRRALQAALVVAHADGLAPEEERMFRDAARALGMSLTEADEMLAALPRA